MKKVFFIPCVMVAMSAQAMEMPAERISPRLNPVMLTKDGHAVVNPVPEVAPARMCKSPEGTVHRLDSVVGYNSDGSKGTLQTFSYDSNNWWVESKKYMWDDGSWGSPVETFFCTRMENGYVLSEVNMAYGYGVRNDYKYDDRGRGIEMTSYSLEGEEWVFTGKGEYDYDDNDNIIEEHTYFWGGSDWEPSSHNIATWDDKHRQTSIEQYYWDGNGWQPLTKVDYEWYDGPTDPDYVPGTEKERMSYRGEYFVVDGKWMLTCITENYFNEDGRVSGQSWKYYNREYDNWYGGDSFDGMFMLCNSWVSEIKYDERGIQNVNRTLQYVPGPEKKLFELGYVEFMETPKENGDFEVLAINRNNVYDEAGNKTGTRIVDKIWYGYNAAGKKLAVYEELPFGGDGPMVPVLEDKWGYDEYGYLCETMSFDFDSDGNRIPSNWVIERHDAEGNTVEIMGHTNGNTGGIKPLFTRSSDEDAPVYELREYCITDNDREDTWEPTNRWLNTFENGQLITHVGYRWNGDDWENWQGQNNYFDFSVAVEDMMVPQLYTDVYKVDRIEYIYGYGDEWVSTNTYYHYSEQALSSVTEVDADALLSFDGRVVRCLDGRTARITVYDMTGGMAMTVSGNEASLADLAAGVYVVKVENADGRQSSMKIFKK